MGWLKSLFAPVRRAFTAISSSLSVFLWMTLLELAAVVWTAVPALAQLPTDAPAGSRLSAAEGPKEKDQGRAAAVPQAATATNRANDAATQVRVRELIYVLRCYRVSERCNEWGAAIRELVTIGKPALPELLLDLKNTDRNATMRALLFAVRAIDDPTTLSVVVEAIPKAEALSRLPSSDCGLVFLDAEIYKFMKSHERNPRKDYSVAYGRPINEILATLHTLSRRPLPDQTKPGLPTTWKTDWWLNWWQAETKAGRAETKEPMIQLPSRKEDLVERDGVRRFGPLFATGPTQRLGSAVDVTIAFQTCSNALSCLDFETGRLYETSEGVRYGPNKVYDRLDGMRWQIENGIDLTTNGGVDLHIWQIDNGRWDTLDADVRSDAPFDIGREDDCLDSEPPRMNTFLFTTREGSRGVMRVHPMDEDSRSRKVTYRLWNRDAIKPHPATQRPPRKPDEWQRAKIVILKEPGFGKQCLFDLESGKVDKLPESIPALDPLPDIEELLKQGGILKDERIAGWARNQGMDIATSRAASVSGERREGAKAPDDGNGVGKISQLTLLAARMVPVTTETFGSLSVAHAKDILARSPASFQLAYLTPYYGVGSEPAMYLFETKSGTIGLLQILKVGDQLSSISFRYELANSPEKKAAAKD